MPAMTDEKSMLVSNSRSIPEQFVSDIRDGNFDHLWSLVSAPLYSNPDLLHDVTIKPVVAYFATVARLNGGEFGVPNHIAMKMYELALDGAKGPRLTKLLREQKIYSLSDSGMPAFYATDWMAELVGVNTLRIRGIPPRVWGSAEGFESIREDKILADWITQAVKREGSSAMATISSLEKKRKEAANESSPTSGSIAAPA
jgi:hypothetical protein